MERVGISGFHAVTAALASPREVHSVLATREAAADARFAVLQKAAAARGVAIRFAGPQELVRVAGSASQGVAAIVEALGEFSVKDLVARAREAGESAFLVAVDGVEDPQNLGAIARSALLAGAHGLVVPERGNAAIGPGAAKAASGAFSLLPVARVSSLGGALASLRRDGLWVLGADANGGKAPWDLDLTQGLVLVFGSEARGLSEATLAALDARVCLPTPGGDLSLNVSAAASAILFERVRQAGQARKPAARANNPK